MISVLQKLKKMKLIVKTKHFLVLFLLSKLCIFYNVVCMWKAVMLFCIGNINITEYSTSFYLLDMTKVKNLNLSLNGAHFFVPELLKHAI